MDDITQAASILGRLGGLAKSAKKKKSAKQNGKKGGRPKKKGPSQQEMVKHSWESERDHLGGKW